MKTEDSSDFGVSAEDLRKYPWQELLAAHPDKDCQTYYQVFGRTSATCRDAGDALGARVYHFLNVIASFRTVFGSETAPYRPVLQYFDGRRSTVPEDLSDPDLDALQGIVNEVEDVEFRARIADLLWVCRRDYKAAGIAVSSLLESSANLLSGELWPPFIERLDRAAAISVRKGFEAMRQTVIDTVELRITEFREDPKNGICCLRLMSILLFLGAGDPKQYAALAVELANGFASTAAWNFSEDYWLMAKSWYLKAGDEPSANAALIAAAECRISRAEEGLSKSPPELFFAAHWMAQGLDALRNAKAAPSRINEIHHHLLSLQKQSRTEFYPIGPDPESMPGFKEERARVHAAVTKHFSGIDFEKALFKLAFLRDPTSLEDLKKNELENSEGLIWDKIFGVTQLDQDGKVADVMQPLGLDHENLDQVALRKKLLHTSKTFGWPFAVEFQIEPARCIIADEHPISFRDLATLVKNNAFIPPGREGIYLRGIQAGFFGDWLVAMHLLVPQLEASFRYVLQQHGVVTSTLESDGTQKERDINQLLWDPTLGEIFDDDYLFDLRGILIEKFGCNLRNDLAHGLMSEREFYTAESVYLWWLVIRMCWMGYKAVPDELQDSP